MAFSRSETEDRRQWPLPPSRPHSTPPHLAMPPSRMWSTPTLTPQTQHWWAQERRGTWEGKWGVGGGVHREGGEETPGGVRLPLPHRLAPPPTPPPPPDTSWHTITWDALTCFTEGRSLGNKEVSGNTHRLCGWISNVVSFSFSSGGFVLYYFVCVETLGSVTCSICSGQWRNWPVSSWLEQREI